MQCTWSTSTFQLGSRRRIVEWDILSSYHQWMYPACLHLLCSSRNWPIWASYMSLYGIKLARRSTRSKGQSSSVRGARLLQWDIRLAVSINTCVEHVCSFVQVAIRLFEPSFSNLLASTCAACTVDKYIPARFAAHGSHRNITAVLIRQYVKGRAWPIKGICMILDRGTFVCTNW